MRCGLGGNDTLAGNDGEKGALNGCPGKDEAVRDTGLDSVKAVETLS